MDSSHDKYKQGHEKHRVDHHFQIGDRVWLHLSKDRLQGKGINLKPIRYVPFTILDKVGNNSFWLELHLYIQMYSVVNVENLKLYEPPIIL